MIKNKLKLVLPHIYDEYQHIIRKKNIKTANRYKNMPFEEQVQLLESMYLEKIGHSLDWNNLRSYTEKMQWEKMYNHDPKKIVLADKYAVRDWVIEKIGEEYLIPLIGVWEKVTDINFNTLPDRFVLKTNNGTGTNLIVKDKSILNIRETKRVLDDWLKTDYGYLNGFEIHYSKISPKIIAEKYIETWDGDLQDYKFLCFGGKPYFCWVDKGRYSNHTRNVYDLEWNLQPWNQSTKGNYEKEIPKPDNFSEMVAIAEKLCADFAQVRVDLYNVDGKIYFGEMTFTNGRGFDPIVPEEYDYVLGDLWIIE